MKKIILSFIGLTLIVLTLHFSMPFYGGLPGVVSRIQGRFITKISVITHDPGTCGLIRGYWSQSLRQKLKERCIKNYIQNVVREVSDCKTEALIPDVRGLANIWVRNQYRQRCLIGHYQIMLGNSLTQQWLPETCLVMRDKLVIFENYFVSVFDAHNNNILPPLTDGDIEVIEQCESFLETPKIYSFLRDITPGEQEKDYIESQKKRVFELK